MRLGIGIGGSLDDIDPCVRLAERAGFESAWVVELEHSAFVQAAAAILASRQLTVGTAIALAFPRAPAITAMEAADLASLSDGRFELGLGSQVRRIVEARFGVEYEHPAARMEDYIRAVRTVWAARRGEATAHDGPYYPISMPTFQARTITGRDTNPMTDPARAGLPDPKVLLAAVGPLMSRTAGRVADGLIGHPFASPRWLAEIVSPALSAGLEETGRPTDACPISASPLIAIASDADAARHAAKLQIAFYGVTPNYSGILRLHGREAVVRDLRRAFVRGDHERMAAAIDDELLDSIAIAGRPDEARHRLAAWEGVATRAILVPPFFGVGEGLGREMWHTIVDVFGTVPAGINEDPGKETRT